MHTAEKRAGVGKDEKEFPVASDVLIIWNLWRGDPNMGKFRRRHNFKNVRRGAGGTWTSDEYSRRTSGTGAQWSKKGPLNTRK